MKHLSITAGWGSVKNTTIISYEDNDTLSRGLLHTFINEAGGSFCLDHLEAIAKVVRGIVSGELRTDEDIIVVPSYLTVSYSQERSVWTRARYQIFSGGELIWKGIFALDSNGDFDTAWMVRAWVSKALIRVDHNLIGYAADIMERVRSSDNLKKELVIERFVFEGKEIIVNVSKSYQGAK
ncbi:hypothetical protein CPT_Moabite_064 [Serratia phage Moabite]|uniref:Uncharacterized protein n=1 Tax=Serratia phage Moabite TaxID=2587814 RepID=A0A4Y5TP21_9CAUD|nr:hypothetical protein HWC48_gp064 [Serratia phage Moabite]QDB71096.1 hypothetical protein CPT_Moabite_064 [Serratia phage Moabite]